MPLWTASRVIGVFLVASLVLVACTDDSDDGDQQRDVVAPVEYMEEVCTAMNDWLADFLAGYQTVRTLDPDSSVRQGKKTLNKFLVDAVASTESLAGAVSQAGTPDVAEGEEFSSALIDALEQARSALDDARVELADLPNDPTRFRTEAMELGDTVRAQLAAAGDALGGRSQELRQAAGETPACQNLGERVPG